MKDSVHLLKPVKRKRKRLQSSESDSSQTSSNSDGSVGISKSQKTRSPERIVISSDTDSSIVEMRNSKKRKRYKHSDLENVQVIHDGHNGKRHRHKCHHHHHHRHAHGHHKHHKLDSNRDREEKAHRKTCSKYKMTQEAVRVKEEPRSDDDDKTRQSHSSNRRPERRRERSEDDVFSRHDQHPETSSGNRERRPDRRNKTYQRKDGNDDRNERTSNERQTERRRINEIESRKDGANKPEERKNSRQGRRNRWGDDEENTINTNRPIKQEPNDGEYEWGKRTDGKKIPPGEKAKPNFGLSGKLTEDTNTFNGVVIKYSEPPEARKPKRRWRLYPFKGDQGLPTLYIHRQSSYLIGRDRKVADIPVDHPSCSKQHAALQYRLVPFERENGTIGKRVRPYIIDLESANGTYVNSVKIEARTYVELLEKDVVKFGYSSREYVLLHEQSKDEELDDDDVGGDNV